MTGPPCVLAVIWTDVISGRLAVRDNRIEAEILAATFGPQGVYVHR